MNTRSENQVNSSTHAQTDGGRPLTAPDERPVDAPVPGVEHWTHKDGVRLFLWQKFVGSPADKPAIQISSRSAGGRSLIVIRDNGPGIALENLAKIFDPFFTTKDVGKGTGLGLSICFGIMRGYGGTISAASEPGKFSEFTLDLPANQEAAAQTKLPHAEPIRL